MCLLNLAFTLRYTVDLDSRHMVSLMAACEDIMAYAVARAGNVNLLAACPSMASEIYSDYIVHLSVPM